MVCWTPDLVGALRCVVISMDKALLSQRSASPRYINGCRWNKCLGLPYYELALLLQGGRGGVGIVLPLVTFVTGARDKNIQT